MRSHICPKTLTVLLVYFLFAGLAFAEGPVKPSASYEKFDERINKIAEHAKQYPPKFISQDERAKTEAELKSLIAEMEAGHKTDPRDQELLWRLGYAYSMAHNLDLAGSADKSSSHFWNLLSINPGHRQGNYLYGVLLVGTASAQKKGVVYLQKAASLGVDDALYMLGKAYYILGDKEKAIEYYKKYADKYPASDAKDKIDGIRTGKLKVKRVK